MPKPTLSTSSQCGRRAAAPRHWLPVLCLLALGASAATNRAVAGPLTFTNYTSANGLAMNPVLKVYANGSSIYTTHYYSDAISVSTDGGANWSVKTSADGLAPSGYATDIAGSGSAVYASQAGGASQVGGLAISTDNGATWNNNTTAEGFPGDDFGTVFVAPGKMYLGSTLGVSISSDGGSTWSSSGAAQGLGGIAVGIYATGSDVYAGTGGGLSVSTDGGATWSNTAFGTDIIWGVWGDGSTVYGATASQGLAVSTNNGSSYSLLTTAQGLVSNDLRGVTVSGGSIYVSTLGGLSISSDGGATWQNYTTANGLADNLVFDAYVDGNTLYVATWGGLSVATLTSAVPEIDPAGMGSVVALLSGALGLLERRRRAPAAA